MIAPVRPSHPTPWIWLLTLFTTASFIEVIFWSQIQSFTPLYLPKLGITDPAQITVWTGAIIAISSAIGLPFLPFWGALADRYARQPVIVRSFVAHLLAGILCVLAGNIWLFVLGRAIQSLALGNSGLMLTILSERVPQRKVGLSFSIMNSAGPVGAFLGPLIGGPIVDAYGFPTLLVVDTLLLIIVILAMTFGFRDNYKGTNRGSIMQMAVGSVGLIFKSARLRALFPALFLLQAGWMLAFSYVSLIVQQLYKGENIGTAIGLVQGASGIFSIILSLIVGGLGDRFGHWRILIGGAVLS
ncbi:MAG: MFS transporter, partial [Chloroflexia bacterium]